MWTTLALVVVGVYLSWTAGRLDRLHARIDAARAALDAQLLRRASVAQELATSGVFDPAASMLLYQSAHDARLAAEESREVAESELSQALRAVLGEPGQMEAVRAVPGGEESVGELAEAVRRVPMARRFHNDAVRAARALRRHRAVRWLRLAGHAPFPLAFEMDDGPPPALVDRSGNGAPAGAPEPTAARDADRAAEHTAAAGRDGGGTGGGAAAGAGGGAGSADRGTGTGH